MAERHPPEARHVGCCSVSARTKTRPAAGNFSHRPRRFPGRPGMGQRSRARAVLAPFQGPQSLDFVQVGLGTPPHRSAALFNWPHFEPREAICSHCRCSQEAPIEPPPTLHSVTTGILRRLPDLPHRAAATRRQDSTLHAVGKWTCSWSLISSTFRPMQVARCEWLDPKELGQTSRQIFAFDRDQAANGAPSLPWSLGYHGAPHLIQRSSRPPRCLAAGFPLPSRLISKQPSLHCVFSPLLYVSHESSRRAT